MSREGTAKLERRRAAGTYAGWRRARRAVLVLALPALLAPPRASAQDVAVRAYLSPGPTVEVGRPFVLNVEITGSQSVGE